MSEIPIALRPAAPGDIDEIVAIERESFSDPWSSRSFRELVGGPNIVCEVAVRRVDASVPDGEGIAATLESGGQPAAVAGGADAPEVVGFSVVYLAGDEGDLANLAIAESARRGGVGRRLLEHVLAVARAGGARVIFLEVRESNVAARALYDSAGFVDVGRRAKYYARPVEDALILRKELS
jgi:ribosomal-protein-alanine N-acetyltransferase